VLCRKNGQSNAGLMLLVTVEGLEHLFSEVNNEGNREDLESPQAARNNQAKIKKDDDFFKERVKS